VIAIISLLVSILLPSLQQARELARTVVCSTSLRQQGFGLIMYLDEHRDVFPPAQPPGGGTVYPNYLGPYVGYSSSEVTAWLPKADYRAGTGIWGCPTRMADPPFVDPYGGLYYACYGLTHRGDGSADWYTRRIVALPDADIIVLADAHNSALLWFWDSRTTYAHRFARRHGQDSSRSNVTFLDGHTETVDWDEGYLCMRLRPW
jgi:prepilin-type processing-associated H-X9-DG protein